MPRMQDETKWLNKTAFGISVASIIAVVFISYVCDQWGFYACRFEVEWGLCYRINRSRCWAVSVDKE